MSKSVLGARLVETGRTLAPSAPHARILLLQATFQADATGSYLKLMSANP